MEDPIENLINFLDLNVDFSTYWLGKLGEIIQLFQAPVPESVKGQQIYFIWLLED